jgi:hypothetical protein
LVLEFDWLGHTYCKGSILENWGRAGAQAKQGAFSLSVSQQQSAHPVQALVVATDTASAAILVSK